MTLEDYREKRKFDDTPEPSGGESSEGPLRFVVQKHAATRLHYDLRLEMSGVLKSWAVPKGPSMNPSDKRLAVMVEDHPLDYQTFEGIIPEGNYGAGTVMIWDRGEYDSSPPASRPETELLLNKGLDKGHISFILHGEKLNGEFTLVKMRGRGENDWLLIKANDGSASDQDALRQDRSAATGRTMDQIASESADSLRYGDGDG